MPPQLLDVPPVPGAKPLKPIRGGKRFVEARARSQMSFEVRRIEDFVSSDAFVRVFDTISDTFNYSRFEAQHPGGGRPAFPPKLLCKLILFGQCEGIRSARQLSKRLGYDVRFMWLAHELAVDHEVLSDFRRDFREELKELFWQTVRLGLALGLASLGHISLDGTKIAAHAQRRAYNAEDLEEARRRIDERFEKMMAEADAVDAAEDAQFGAARGDEVPPELADAAARRAKIQQALQALAESEHEHISLTDPEAPLQKTQDGTRPGYNAQAAVDSANGYVVGQDVTTDQNDTQQFMPIAQQTIENVGRVPDEFAADSGYHSPETLEAVAASEVPLNVYINQQTEDDGKYGHEAFAYDETTDSFTCPEGRTLSRRGFKVLRDTTYQYYRAVCTCRDCPRREQCISEKARYRELLIAPHEHLLLAMRRKLATPEGRRALQRRKETVERTFGTMKAVLGLRQFLLRGLEGARVEFCLCATAINLRKLAQWLSTEGTLEQLRAGAQQMRDVSRVVFAALLGACGATRPTRPIPAASGA